MAWLHTWTGLLVGWFLFVIFLSGTTAYFQSEITRWMTPELSGQVTSQVAAQNAVNWLSAHKKDAVAWDISLPDKRGGPVTVYWTSRPEPGKEAKRNYREDRATLDPASGEVVTARDTKGGFFLYRFHFDLHYMPVMWARWIVGFCAMMLLTACLTGIVTHKKIFADFFMLRFGKGQRSWLDAHNVSAVMGLPFILMITYTGLVTLASLYMPWPIKASGLNRESYYAELYPQAPVHEPVGRPPPLTNLATVFEATRNRWNSDNISYLSINNPGDEAATITATSAAQDRIDTRGARIQLDGVTGQVLWNTASRGAEARTEGVMIGLHAGRYAGPMLRWLYFISGVGGTMMVATGLILWTSKRRLKLPDPERPHFGFRLVEKLNIGFITGFPAGIATYFLANRLLPLDLAKRADWEVHSLFIAWGAVLVWAVARPSKRGWIEGLSLCAGLYALVPIVNAATTSRGLIDSMMAGDWLFVSFDSVMWLTAALFALAARKTALHKPMVKARKKPLPVTSPETI
ncbi:MAG: PepSY-associated TM helix domain-containing protein [Asticcacaulis sp.]|uniref:PepSY-associated TM helix domain-containing protein n=1 Tax=Asticcacaulis sp. TaxID=1872648 RepID=UPI0039E2F62F